MLQSVPAQVVSQVHVASLLHTCTEQTGRDELSQKVITHPQTIKQGKSAINNVTYKDGPVPFLCPKQCDGEPTLKLEQLIHY